MSASNSSKKARRAENEMEKSMEHLRQANEAATLHNIESFLRRSPPSTVSYMQQLLSEKVLSESSAQGPGHGEEQADSLVEQTVLPHVNKWNLLSEEALRFILTKADVQDTLWQAKRGKKDLLTFVCFVGNIEPRSALPARQLVTVPLDCHGACVHTQSACICVLVLVLLWLFLSLFDFYSPEF